MKKKAAQDPTRIQKSFYLHIKNKAAKLETGHSREMRQYFQGQKRFLKRPFQLSRPSQLFQAVKRSQVIYLGDFHTFDQSSRNLERLIRLMLEERAHDHQIVLGMEMVMHQYQTEVDEFLRGHISEDELLDSINYHESWRFPWTHYRTFFHMAREHGIRILALNSQGTLRQRDAQAATLICQQLSQDKNQKIFVLFGEAHIFPNKLPKSVARHCPDHSVVQTIIHQNLDDIFWKIQEQDGSKNKRQHKDEIISFNKNEFCLLTSPPWVKYESMVYWYENISDDPDYDLHSAQFEAGMKKFTENTHDTFLYLLQHLKNFFTMSGARTSIEDLSDFNLYDASKIDFITRQIAKADQSRSLLPYVEGALKKGRPFALPGSYHYYSPSYSFNRMALLAGIHLYTFERGKGTLKHLLEDGPAEGRFVYFLNMEMVSYYCSKIINPYRKCDMFLDLKHKSTSSLVPARKRVLIKLALNFLKSGSAAIKTGLNRRRPLFLHDLARILGPFMAEMAIKKFGPQHPHSEGLHRLLFQGDLTLETFMKLRQLCCGDFDQLKNTRKRFF